VERIVLNQPYLVAGAAGLGNSDRQLSVGRTNRARPEYSGRARLCQRVSTGWSSSST